MDWPHDPDSDEGSERGRKYGQAVLAKKIDEDGDFPLTQSEFVSEFGDHPIRIDYETVVSVSEVFEHVDQEGFEDFPDFHKAVGQALRDADYWPYRLEHA